MMKRIVPSSTVVLIMAKVVSINIHILAQMVQLGIQTQMHVILNRNQQINVLLKALKSLRGLVVLMQQMVLKAQQVLLHHLHHHLVVLHLNQVVDHKAQVDPMVRVNPLLHHQLAAPAQVLHREIKVVPKALVGLKFRVDPMDQEDRRALKVLVNLLRHHLVALVVQVHHQDQVDLMGLEALRDLVDLMDQVDHRDLVNQVDPMDQVDLMDQVRMGQGNVTIIQLPRNLQEFQQVPMAFAKGKALWEMSKIALNFIVA